MRNPQNTQTPNFFCKCRHGRSFGKRRGATRDYSMRVMVPQFGHFIWLAEKIGDS